jgi:hypothetical protein
VALLGQTQLCGFLFQEVQKEVRMAVIIAGALSLRLRLASSGKIALRRPRRRFSTPPVATHGVGEGLDPGGAQLMR